MVKTPTTDQSTVSDRNKLGYFKTFVFRSPLFSLSHYDQFIQELDSGKIPNGSLFHESLYLATPEFIRELTKRNPVDVCVDKKFKLSALKYLTRMSTRCTPFGLFSGCGVGHIGEKNKIRLSCLDRHTTSTRLDMNYLCALIREIESFPHVRSQLLYFTNSSLYDAGTEFRYVEQSYFGTFRKHTLTSLTKDHYLDIILKNAKSGATIDTLANFLVSEEITLAEAEEYILELIQHQILTSSIEPTVTGGDLLTDVIDSLKKMQGTEDVVMILKQVREEIEAIDKLPIGRAISLYEKVHGSLRAFQTPINPKFLFQSNLLLNTNSSTLSEHLLEEIQEGISVVNRLTPKAPHPHLEKFKKEFLKRYDNEEVPLVIALDPEVGIGFGEKDHLSGDINPLLKGIIHRQNENNDISISKSPIADLIHHKYDKFLSMHPRPQDIELTENDLRPFLADYTDLPATFSVMIKLVKDQKIVLSSVGGSTAANMLGRLCSLNPEIETLVRDITLHEQKFESGKVVAEILHLPESRLGNILSRPTLREFEIPYLARPTLPSNRHVRIDDLMLSVQNDRIVLRSLTLNKEIIPMLTNAHNFLSDGLPIYEFLCCLQNQNKRGFLGFRWNGSFLEKQFLPRIRYRNLILSPARWVLKPDDFKIIPDIEEKDFFSRVQELRSHFQLPQKVLLVEKDNKLLIDFSSLSSTQLLCSLVRKRTIQLEEFFDQDADAIVTDGSHSYANEVILCFYRH